MERIDKHFLSENLESLHVDVFRHGKAKYEQKQVPIDQARDLTEEGIQEIKENAEELSNLIQPDEEVEIWSSPMGRNLHTAKIIAETLEQKGVRLRRKGNAKESGIKVFQQLSEVKNFSWNLFSPLITGGEVQFGGRKFFINKELTNPNNIPYPEYFIEDRIKDIPAESKAQLPEDYVREIEGFEKFIDVTKRMMKPLARLKKLKDKPYRVIIVTHDALMGFIANVFSGGECKGVNPGEFINLERREGKLVATRVGKLQKGDTETDVIDEFNLRHGYFKE